MKYFLFIFGCLCVSSKGIAQIGNTNISMTAAFSAEPYIAVNPANHANVVIAWMALDLSTGLRVSIKTKVSLDGGASWGNQNVLPHASASSTSADVSMAFSRAGVLFLTYIDHQQSPDSGGVFIIKSINGGVSWQTPVKVFDIRVDDPAKLPIDRPWLAMDNSTGVAGGNLYITTKPAPWIAGPNRPYIKSSSDGGATWSALRYIDSTGYLAGNLAVPMATPATNSQGVFATVYPSYNITGKFVMAKSGSRSLGFQYSDMPLATTPVTDNRYKLGYKLVSNPSNPNQYAIVLLGNNNGEPDVFVLNTNNGGGTWSAPKRVNDDPLGNSVGQDMVWASYDSLGTLLVTWRDRRNGTGTGFAQPSDFYGAVSRDNGNTFLPNFRLSNMTSAHDTILANSGNDFMSSELVRDTIYACWSDIRSGRLNIYFVRTAVRTVTSIKSVVINEEDNPFSIFPNPAHKEFFIRFDNPSLKEVVFKLYNELGQEVMNKKITAGQGNSSLDVSSLKSGIYFVVGIYEGVVIKSAKVNIQ
jgi:Secretion system C-terminal sorting domain